MQSRLRLAGQGVQPLLLMFPLGLFWTAVVFDLATLLGAPTLIGTVAFWNLVAGLGGGVLAALAAVFDAVSADSAAAARVFCLALLLDIGVLIVLAILALMRVRDPDRAVDASLLAVEAGGLAAALFGAWFGGRFGPRDFGPGGSGSGGFGPGGFDPGGFGPGGGEQAFGDPAGGVTHLGAAEDAVRDR